ncbi:MAG: hypothetical protein CSA97_00965 [Bacteroidetes bacterium]|nr:MAG: hypothetical protein CSA97_00965 [Bacteroidota bacterium]
MRKLWILALLLAGGVSFVACDKDDGDDMRQEVEDEFKLADENQPEIKTLEDGVFEVKFRTYLKWGKFLYIDFQEQRAFFEDAPKPYYSLEGEVVDAKPENQIEPTNWDIAFHHFYPMTNGGEALKSEQTELSQVTAVPATGTWVKDTQLESFKKASGSANEKAMVRMLPTPQKFAKLSYNEVLCGFDMSTGEGMDTQHDIQDNVFVVKVREKSYALKIFAKYGTQKWVIMVHAKELK